MTQILKGLCRVKNTIAFKEGGRLKLKHYSTIILEINDATKEIVTLKPVTQASEKAIMQVLKVFSMEDQYINACIKLNGKTPREYKRENKDCYSISLQYAPKRLRQHELLEL